jgi:hypothetical protein
MQHAEAYECDLAYKGHMRSQQELLDASGEQVRTSVLSKVPDYPTADCDANNC